MKTTALEICALFATVNSRERFQETLRALGLPTLRLLQSTVRTVLELVDKEIGNRTESERRAQGIAHDYAVGFQGTQSSGRLSTKS